MENINKEYLQAAIHLYEYMGYIYCTFDELLDTINEDWEHGYLTEHDGVDGKVYLWYLDIAQMDDNRSVAMCKYLRGVLWNLPTTKLTKKRWNVSATTQI